MPIRFQVDGDFYDHPKTIGMSPEAYKLWTRAGSYSAANQTRGYISRAVVAEVLGASWETATELVRRRLWKRSPGGFEYVMDQPKPLGRWNRNGARDWIPNWLRRAVYDRDNHRCIQCGTHHQLSLDHIIPWSQGGRDTFENLRTYCLPCNWARGARA